MSPLCDNCKKERCNDRWKCHIISCPSYTEKKKQTNADRIRAMTDEELAKLMNYVDCSCCPVGDNCKIIACEKQLLEWLQQPAKEDNNGRNPE